MFSALFGSKQEKLFKHVLETAPELSLQFEEGDNAIPSKIMRVNRDSLLIMGFKGKIKQRNIILTSYANGMRFRTQISATGSDRHGTPTFLVKMSDQAAPKAGYRRYPVYSHGSLSALVGTRSGDRSIKFPIYEVSQLGIGLVNNSDLEIRPGSKLYQAMGELGSARNALVDLQVANIRKIPLEGKQHELLVCIFTHEGAGKDELVNNAKSVAPKPRPAK